MKKISANLLILIPLLFLFVVGCEPYPEFETVTIGEQIWMAENMKILTGNSCCYNYDLENCETYGMLYDWETAMTVCPTGWHLPSADEFQQLADYLGGDEVAGGKIKSTGTIEEGTGLWYAHEKGSATNETGFTAHPGGFRNTDGNFDLIGRNAGWWSSTEVSSDTASTRVLSYSCADFDHGYSNKKCGLSVRCLRD